MSCRELKYKIVIFDIGKTLLDKSVSNKISDRILDDIKQLRNLGIKVGVCTMRTVKHCKEIIPVDLDFYICLNGSYIWCDNKLIYEKKVDFENINIDYLSYGSELAFYSSECAKTMAIANGFLIDNIGVAVPAYNVVLFNIEQSQLPLYDEFHYEYWSSTKTIVLQNKETSKVNGIKQVLNYYNLTQPILYFGDGPNDLDIFKTYNYCVCMGDCYTELEKYALFKTDTCANQGVSLALRILHIL